MRGRGRTEKSNEMFQDDSSTYHLPVNPNGSSSLGFLNSSALGQTCALIWLTRNASPRRALLKETQKCRPSGVLAHGDGGANVPCPAPLYPSTTQVAKTWQDISVAKEFFMMFYVSSKTACFLSKTAGLTSKYIVIPNSADITPSFFFQAFILTALQSFCCPAPQKDTGAAQHPIAQEVVELQPEADQISFSKLS